jgi:hypothetical protein
MQLLYCAYFGRGGFYPQGCVIGLNKLEEISIGAVNVRLDVVQNVGRSYELFRAHLT